MTRPLGIVADAILAADSGHPEPRALAGVAADALADERIIDNAVAYIRANGYVSPDVADLSDRDLRALVRVAFCSVGA